MLLLPVQPSEVIESVPCVCVCVCLSVCNLRTHMVEIRKCDGLSVAIHHAKRTLGRRNFTTRVAEGASTLRRFHLPETYIMLRQNGWYSSRTWFNNKSVFRWWRQCNFSVWFQVMYIATLKPASCLYRLTPKPWKSWLCGATCSTRVYRKYLKLSKKV